MNKQPNPPLKDWVIIGRFGRVHGVKGGISVISFTEPKNNLFNYSNWHVFINRDWQAITYQHVLNTPKQTVVIVEGFADRETAGQLTNKDIAISSSQLPKLGRDEYYWHQLIGMQVFDQEGLLLGTISNILPTGANDVLVVNGEKRLLIPYILHRYITAIDLEKKAMTVAWNTEF